MRNYLKAITQFINVPTLLANEGTAHLYKSYSISRIMYKRGGEGYMIAHARGVQKKASNTLELESQQSGAANADPRK